MKKRLLLLLLTVGLCGIFTGCGSNNENKLEVYSAKMENKDMLQKLIDGYISEHPDVTIEFMSPPDAGTVLRTKLTKNRVPDVIFMGGDMLYTDMQGAEILTDLTDESYSSNIKEVYKQQVYALNEDKSERMFGVPFATNAEGIIYNEDIFAENNIQVPKTYDELIAVCKTLEEKGIQPFYFTLKDAWTASAIWNSVTGNVIDPKAFGLKRLAGETTFAKTHQEVAEISLELIKYGQEDILGTGYDDGNIAFANGEAAMYIQGNWAITNIKKSNPDINLNMTAFPALNDADENKVISGIDVMVGISKTTTQEALAKDFLEYVFRPENIEAYINDQFAFSAAEGIDQKDESVTGLQSYLDREKIGEFVDHYYPTGFDIGPIVQAFLGKQGDIGTFLKDVDKQFDKYNAN